MVLVVKMTLLEIFFLIYLIIYFISTMKRFYYTRKHERIIEEQHEMQKYRTGVMAEYTKDNKK